MSKQSTNVLRNALTALCIVAVAGAAAQAQQPDLKNLPVALKQVPGDAAGFIHVRLADLFSSPSLVLSKISPAAWAAFEKKYVPAPSSMDTLTIVFPAVDSFSEWSPGDPDAVTPLFVISTNKPYDRQQLEKSISSQARLRKHKGREYFTVEHDWSGFHFVDERTFIVGSWDAVYRFVERGPVRSEGPLQAALLTAADKHHLTAGFNPAVLPRDLPAPPRGEKLSPADLLAHLPALLRAHCVTWTVDFAQETKCRVNLDFTDEKHAEDAVRAGRDLLRTLAGLARQGADEAEEQFKRAPARTFQPELDPRPLHKNVESMTFDLFQLGTAGFMRVIEAGLLKLPVQRQGAQVSVEAAFPVNANALLFAVAGISSLGTNANKTFTNVGSSMALAGERQPVNEAARHLAKAFEEYHKKHGRFPAWASHDAEGQPLLSWRVELLPFLGHADLYRQFKLDEPWDSVHNKKLLTKMPKVFRSTEWQPRWKTPYQVIVGPGAAFEGAKGLSRGDFKDALEQTLLAVDAGERYSVSWSKPVDLSFGPRQEVPGFDNLFGFSAVFADGSARFVTGNIDQKVLRALITRSGGEPLEEVTPGVWRLPPSDARLNSRPGKRS